MNTVLRKALDLWGLQNASCTLIAARENAVYRVDTGAETFALRLHRAHYRSDAELASELDWMRMLTDAGLSIPSPVAMPDGRTLAHVDGTQVDLLTWLAGAPLDQVMPNLSTTDRTALFDAIGQTLARLHIASDGFAPPLEFTRCAWDADGLIGDTPLWGRFWDNPELGSRERAILLEFRDFARVALARANPDLDYGLIHADLVPANVMVDGPQPCFIDFDDGGFGYRVFDIATTLFKWRDAFDAADLQSALLRGYRMHRTIDIGQLPLFFALRAVSYVGWNISRMHEPGGPQRNRRFIETAIACINAGV